MYRAFLNLAIGSMDREMGCLILEKARVHIIRGPRGVLHYCEKDQANYIVITDTFLPLRGCGSPKQGSSPLKKTHLPATPLTDGGGRSDASLAV